MSKLGSNSGTVLNIAHAGRSATLTASPWLPFGLRAMPLPRLSGSVPAHVARFPPASARFAYNRALFNFDPSPSPQNTSSRVRQRRAKPEAEREAKGEASLLAEPCADLAALPKGAGGRTALLKGTPLRLCALATLRFCLFCISLKQHNPLKNSKL